jgi:serine protease inhibitor
MITGISHSCFCEVAVAKLAIGEVVEEAVEEAEEEGVEEAVERAVEGELVAEAQVLTVLANQ